MVSELDILNSRVFIVDDNPANVELLEKVLSLANFTSVLGITDPRQVEDLYGGYQPDIILLDINMPNMNGYEVMARLKEIGGDNFLPILVLTAQQDTQTRLKALDAGAMDFLTKPFNKTEVLTRIRNLLMVRLMHNELHNQNKILEEKVQERTKELHDTRLEIIRRLGLAAEFKDNETGFHIIRMSKTCKIMGDKMGMDKNDSDILLHASPMHDIGKIGIPDNIMLKPGKLDAEEWETMKTHTLLGARILGGHDSDILKMAKEIALTHHEKWDGSGYPFNLSGEGIPLSGRISAVADVFDALTSERPYKKAWTVEDSVAEIKRSSGSHFDPEMVEVFLSCLDDILKVKAQYEEPV